MKHGGEIAAPVVRDVVKAYYDKKNGVKQQLTATASASSATPEVPSQSPVAPQPQALAESKPALPAGKNR
jgi:hypothetical protein